MNAKVAISLPEDLLRLVEAERKRRGVSRSEFFRLTVQEHLDRIRERELDERYVEGYRRFPETEAELEGLTELATEAWRDLPWDDDETK